MKTLLQVTVLVTSLAVGLLGTGCDSADQAAQNVAGEVKSPDLEHNWQENNCASIGSLSFIGASVQTSYDFSGAQVTKTEQIFSSADCTNPAISIAYVGTFSQKDQVSDGVYQLDFSYTNVTVTGQNAAGINVLNTTDFCGNNAWVANQGVNLTSQARNALCPLDNLPVTQYTIYSIQNGNLVLGQGDDTTDPTTRPTALDEAVTYKQL